MSFCQIYMAIFLTLYMNLVNASNIPELNQIQVSEALGHFIWSELKNDTSTPLLLEAVIEGMRKAEADIPCPLTNDQLQQCFMQFEEDHYNAQASRNLAKAEKFLDQLKTNPEIQILIPGRLYIQILSPGTADAEINEKTCFHIKCELIDGTELLNTFRTDMPATQDPKSAIRGFKEGISGMKEGEKRRLFIHPEYGYGKFCHIEPNSLLIVDVELLSRVK
jgi:peptidylprolyl isomerase